MTVLDKRKKWKYLRFHLHEEEWNEAREQASKEGMPLATWVRSNILKLIRGRAFNED